MIITHHFKYKYLNYIIGTFLLLEYLLRHNWQRFYQDITSTLKINAREYRRDNQKGQSRETGNTGYTRHRTKINVREYRRGNQKGQSRETCNTGYTRHSTKINVREYRRGNQKRTIQRRQTKQTHNTIWVGQRHTQTNTNNVNKTCTLQQTTGGKDKPNIVFLWES